MFNTEGPIYMGSNRNPQDCKVAIYGVPYDGTTSFRAGTRFGPNAIREVSTSLETYCPDLKLDLNDYCYADLGSLDIPLGAPEKVIQEVTKASKSILNKNIKSLMLGGEHSLTCGVIKTLYEKYPDLILIQLDAHADLREVWQGTKYSHACAMRRCLDIIPSEQLLQIGIRSGTRTEFQELNNSKRLISQKHGKPAIALSEALQNKNKSQPIYLTVDLDWFDPSVVPGTGTPEPGGFNWFDFVSILKVIQKYNLISADVVELSPQLDLSASSSILAAKVVRSLLLLLLA